MKSFVGSFDGTIRQFFRRFMKSADDLRAVRRVDAIERGAGFYAVAADYERLDRMAKEYGSKLTAPFMTLSFLALLVIPALKLGPQGLFDVRDFRPTKLFD